MPGKSTRRLFRSERVSVATSQISIIAVFLASWQYLPQIDALSDRYHLLNPFFISSPSRVFMALVDLLTGRGGSPFIWHFVWPTVSASLLGTAIGMVSGGALGLSLSNSVYLSKVVNPFVLAANAIPRIALIPIVILIVGPTFKASVLICVLVVLFVAFFNAFEGGRSMEPHLLENAKVLGATKRQVMLHVRLPYVIAWTLAVLPLATTFGIITVVTAEIFTGHPGLGQLLYTASITGDSSSTFAIVVVLSAVGLAVVGVANMTKGRVLHWWGAG